MKYLSFAVVLVILYGVGYALGPSITPLLVKEAKPSEKLKKQVKIAGVNVIIPVDLAEMRDAELPKQVKLVIPVNLPLVAGVGTKQLEKGTEVTLKNRDGDLLIVESLDTLAKGKVPVSATDIFETVAKERFAGHQAKGSGEKIADNSGDKKTAPEKPEPAKPTEPEEKKKSDDIAKKDDPMKPVPTKEPADDKPTEKPAEDPVTKLTDEQILEGMKVSIKGGALKEVTFKSVIDWSVGENHKIDGTEYQVGVAKYKGKTIFGVKEIKARALFTKGKLEKWIYGNSDMQIQ